MTLEEENATLRKRLSAAQHLIHLQRARERQVRSTRLAIVSGNHAEQVDTEAETAEAARFMAQAETKYVDLVNTIRFYAAPANYKDHLGITSLNSPVAADAGQRARGILHDIT